MLIQGNYRMHPNKNHPENWMRVEWIEKEFPDAQIVNIHLKKAEELACTLHPRGYVNAIKKLSDQGAGFGDNPFFSSTYEAALGAVYASVKAMERLDFAAVRPPGHHASEEKFAGFCYFNNIAIAVKNSNKRTAIIDIDAHYGDGTHKIFMHSENIFYASIQGNTDFCYPFYELKSRNSKLINIPPTTGDEEYIEYLKELLESVLAFKPELIGVSAGFDTYFKDPVLGFSIKKIETYREIGKMIKEFGLPAFAVLEGGYSQELGKLVRAFYEGLFVK
ncbi:MAG: histone deacetylase [Candidatus Anstonellales archaeon]